MARWYVRRRLAYVAGTWTCGHEVPAGLSVPKLYGYPGPGVAEVEIAPDAGQEASLRAAGAVPVAEAAGGAPALPALVATKTGTVEIDVPSAAAEEAL